VNIVFDSNIYIDNPKIESLSFSLLIDYLEKTKSSIYLPRLVLEEISAVFKRRLESILSKINGNINNFNSFATHQIILEKPNLDIEVDKFITHAKEKLHISDNNILEYSEEYFKEALSRAIHHIRPCTEDKEEIRDTIIWLSLIDLAKKSPENIIAFISNNTSDYAEKDKKTLHCQLVKDLIANGVDIKYFVSIDDFISEQLPKVNKYSEEYIKSKLDYDYIENDLNNYFQNNSRELERLAERKDYNFQSFSQITNIDLSIYKFNIYEMKKENSCILQIDLYDEIELEAEVECMRPSFYSLDEYETGTKIKYFYTEIHAMYNILIENDEFTTYDLEELEFY